MRLLALLVVYALALARPADAGNTSTKLARVALKKWKASLLSPPDRVIEHNPRHFFPTVGTFGTVAESTWRREVKTVFALLLGQLHGDKMDHEAGASSMVYDPQRAPGTWKPEYAIEEAEHLSNDRVIIFGVDKKFSSVGSMAELGFVGALSFLKSRKTIAFLNPANEDLGANVVRAREMSIVDAKYVQRMLPESWIFSTDKLKVIESSFTEQAAFVDFLKSPISSRQISTRFTPRGDIVKRVAVSGTSHEQYSTGRLKLMSGLKKAGVPFVDTYSENWTIDHYEQHEIPLKDQSLVNTVLITDRTSHGATKDVGLAVFRAIANGTYAVISMPEPGAEKDDYARAHALVRAHWNKLVKDFPWVAHYVRFVKTPEEMAKAANAIVQAYEIRNATSVAE